MLSSSHSFFFFFFNDTATTEIYTLSLHDALPIFLLDTGDQLLHFLAFFLLRAHQKQVHHHHREEDRKSTRLNSSHLVISYAVFCLKKKKINSWPAILQSTLCCEAVSS